MPRKGNRERIALGIFRDHTGYEVQVNRGRGKGNSKRFPATEDPDADLRTMRRWQLRRETELLIEPRTPTLRADTLTHDVPRYLGTLTGRSRRDAETLLDHWLTTPLARLHRHEITPVMIRTEMATWEKAGVSASSINHRVSKLRALYRVLDEHDINTPNPTLKIRKLEEPAPEPREIPRTFVDDVFAAMPDRGRPTRDTPRPEVSKTKARLRVIATTGLPHKQVGLIERQHVDWATKALYVTPRRKGKGTQGKWLPLTPAAVAALRDLFKKGAHGPFDPSAAARTWHRAVKTVKEAFERDHRPLPPLPQKLRPYDLRHTFLTTAYRHSKDPKAVQELGLHADAKTTARYIVGAVNAGTREAVQKVARWHRTLARQKSRRKRTA